MKRAKARNFALSLEMESIDAISFFDLNNSITALGLDTIFNLSVLESRAIYGAFRSSVLKIPNL